MSAFHFGEIGVVLDAAKNTSGVSFAGKSLKLDGEEDVQELVKAIGECGRLEYLDLEGNTLGPEAARALAKALEFHGSHLKRALWKDMFTGRMKNEIPVALSHLGAGLCIAGTNLVELDLSDNAFGPIGVQGLAELLSSSTCYTLETLRLNNNGLGITGGKMLARALLDCHADSSKQGGRPMALKVFVAGRNRLENEGAKALAAVFEKLKTLEEVVMPQNGIYHVGIAALASGLSVNPNLKILNLNDNTVGFKGAKALAKALPNFPLLEVLNLGDCLLKTRGATVLAEALGGHESHAALTELNLSYNEIHARGVNPIAEAMANKTMLNSLQLDGNAFGNEGRTLLRESLASIAKIDSLGSLEEDESECESENEDEDDQDGEEEEDDEEDDDEEEEEEEEEESVNENEIKESSQERKKETKRSMITVEEFLKSPNGESLLLIHGDKVKGFINHAKNQSLSEETPTDYKYTEALSKITMIVSSLSESGYLDVRAEAEKLSDSLYSELFSHATKNNQISNLNNALLVNLGLIKSEGKSVGKIDGNLEGCFKVLEKVSAKEYFVQQTKDTLKVFLQKPGKIGRTKVVDPLQGAKDSLKSVLDRTSKT